MTATGLRLTSALALAWAAGLACSEAERPDTLATAPTVEPAIARGEDLAVQAEVTADEHAHEHAHARPKGERPLPAFSGYTLDGAPLSVSSLIGRRLVIFFFNPEVEEAPTVARAVAAVAKHRAKRNFEIVGVAMGASSDTSRRFVSETGLGDIAVFDDSSARIANQLGLRSPLYVIGVDPEGYVSFGMAGFFTEAPGAVDVIAAQLGDQLRLPKGEEGPAILASDPTAPAFEARRLEGGEPYRSSEFAGRPAVLIFFLHTCSHCHSALEVLKKELEKIPEAARPVLLGVSLQDRPTAVREILKSKGLDFFPVLIDTDRKMQNDFGVFGGVPDISLIDSQGRIVHHVNGWREERDPALMRMFLTRIAGQPVPMILNPRGYTGSDVCGVCHQAEFASWQVTAHSQAFDTLVSHGSDRDSECISCHVVGFDEPGGYGFEDRPKHLEGVGCESCHGRGGPHLSPNFLSAGSYAEACATCHNPTHSLGFEYASFQPKISHRAIAALSPEELEALLATRERPRDVLPKNAEHVGSEACRSCHAAEFETWSAGPHARSVDTLEHKGEAANSDCLACHTTAFGRPGGFEKDAPAASQADLARVGCESCHGPGGNHVAENSSKRGSVVSLGDKCDSCVILQICGSCHDDINDPGFEFKVEERIEAQRHGTIEAGTGKPLETARREIEAALARAFERVETGS